MCVIPYKVENNTAKKENSWVLVFHIYNQSVIRLFHPLGEGTLVHRETHEQE